MTSRRMHPLRKELSDYEQGNLSDDEASAIEKHLQDCARCRQTLELIRDADPDARRLRDVLSDSVGDTSGEQGQEQPDNPEDTDKSPTENEWVVPDYERIKLCGEGAYGAVWAVRDRVGVYRALKIIDLKKATKAKVGCRERIALETYCRKVARHPHLIGIYHVGEIGDQLYYTMDLADDHRTKDVVRGELPDNYRPFTLNLIMRKSRRPKADAAIEIVRRLLGGLAELHKQDLVHRDIKPSNVVFVRRTPRLADIGMMSPGTDSKAIVGTPRYMPPDRIIDKTADTFAMGKILHELLAGHDAEVFPELPHQCLTTSMKWDIERVSNVIVRACAPKADDRYANADEMLSGLESCGDFGFHTLFDEVDPDEVGAVETEMAPPPIGAQILLAALRAIPYVLGFVALLIVLHYLRGS